MQSNAKSLLKSDITMYIFKLWITTYTHIFPASKYHHASMIFTKSQPIELNYTFALQPNSTEMQLSHGSSIGRLVFHLWSPLV